MAALIDCAHNDCAHFDSAHYENIKPHNASFEDWCIPADMHGRSRFWSEWEGQTRQWWRKWGGEWLWSTIGLKLTERIEVDDENPPDFEEEWNYPEQTEVDKWVETDFALTMETLESKRIKDMKI